MIALQYFMLLSAMLFAIGIAGVLASRHFLIMMLSVELALVASTLLAVSFFYFSQGGNILVLLLAIWSVASAEIIAIVVFYRYIVRKEVNLDVSKLSKLRN